MMQQTNLSEKNAFCRFAMGTSLTAFGIAKVSRNPDCTRGRLMIALGAMKMAEGLFKYCPTKAILSSNMQNAMNSSMQSMFNGQNSMSSEQINQLMKDFSSAIAGNSSNAQTTAAKEGNTSTSTQNSSNSSNSSTNKAQNPS
ncbi:YgaP-like transmembrane domain [Lysinibacillus sp. FSL K6-0232]|uniref:YgaP-like transmembrane domain n=1 Tax=unclassified Lysinibacillus TaxID=2636778 RepID=UPI0030FC5492